MSLYKTKRRGSQGRKRRRMKKKTQPHNRSELQQRAAAERREAPGSGICMSNLGPGTKTNPPHASSARSGSGWLPGCLPTAALSFWEASANKPLPCPAANTHPKAVDFRAGSQPVARPAPPRSDARSFPGPPPMGYGPAGTGAGPINCTRLKIHSASGILLFYCSLVCAHHSRYR